ncbi:hypothetical protein GXB81_13980 [Paraburkholderia sp. Ac-20336]|uniref:hypothetical protein n=1 Tax=Paraburkholderia sp. Ac-20336 TaxID=2703886 RepID=UPI00197E9320|nr:hypothetical protein [Paraburkholderia sp. Ac-20336]MBN3804149.1 hypothetical protein [Paraburkholderia sp. Ac-20336]
MKLVNTILWYGARPLAGELDRLELRGFKILFNLATTEVHDALLSTTLVAVLSYKDGYSTAAEAGFSHLAAFVDHNIRVIILGTTAEQALDIRKTRLNTLDETYAWDKVVYIRPDLKDVNFDLIVNCQPGRRWHDIEIEQIGPFEKLGDEELRLVARAFQRADELHLRELSGGRSGSKVFMAYERRREEHASFGHWTQPRLVKVGDRKKLGDEVGAMKEVSPYVPFELRPNLEVFVEGLKTSVYVADFVDKSESLLKAAREGRGEAAISNLFNRTLQRWRDRAKELPKHFGSPAEDAVRLGVASPDWIDGAYLTSERIRRQNFDVQKLWASLCEYKFGYRAATIHGDLHGDNVRVRGDDAILIDLGAVRGTTENGDGAPLCIDVATLEVSLVFDQPNNGNSSGDPFEQPGWERQIAPFYDLDAILTAPGIDAAPTPDSWLFGCLQRIRSFGTYEQSDDLEYPIALVIALWRYCKFEPKTAADKGRRVVALELGAKLIAQIRERVDEGNSNSR